MEKGRRGVQEHTEWWLGTGYKGEEVPGRRWRERERASRAALVRPRGERNREGIQVRGDAALRCLALVGLRVGRSFLYGASPNICLSRPSRRCCEALRKMPSLCYASCEFRRAVDGRIRIRTKGK